jgi:prepilin-type N-terminal cleavage/methylation domain-containing protein
MRQRAFSLIELLVSVMIFSVVSIALIGVLTAASRLFRLGESSRAAHDEAVAVLAQLDDDLQRMVPPADGGFLYARVRSTNLSGSYAPDPWRSMVLAFKLRNPDIQGTADSTVIAGTSLADSKTGAARQIVTWFVDNAGNLQRVVLPALESDPAILNGARELDQVAAAIAQGNAPMSANCLYFGVDLSLDQPLPPGTIGTRSDLSWTNALPTGTDKYCTENNPSLTANGLPFPRALRVVVTLTGGSRNLLRGTVVKDDENGIKIAGIAQVPVGPGAVARIGGQGAVEWVAYDRAAGGLLTWQNGQRPQSVRRTATTPPIVHARGEPIAIGTTFTLVRNLPR